MIRYQDGTLTRAAAAAQWAKRGSSKTLWTPRQFHSPEEESSPTPWFRATVLGVGTGMAVGMAMTAAVSAAAGYFARMVVTPVKEHAEDLEILATVRGRDADEVILPATAETMVDGHYGLFFDGGRSFARIGNISSYTPRDGTLARRVESVNTGDLRSAVRGWWSSVVYLSPEEAGFEAEEVVLELPGGRAPAWFVPGNTREGPLAGRNIWGIMVHGRGGRRTEGIKALPAAADLGINSLLISYRNDGEAPPAPDGKYGLGITEWEDVEVAIRYALDHGASEVVLFGWSMGGAICLQAADRSPLTARVRGLVLTGPVIDWINVLASQAKALKVPTAVGRLTRWLISNKAGRRLTGLAAPVDLKALNWTDRADQLHVRTLILHSIDDPLVPYGPSRDLAQKNPMVTFVPFNKARHVKEWNHDPRRWDDSVKQWLIELFNQPEPGLRRLRDEPREAED